MTSSIAKGIFLFVLIFSLFACSTEDCVETSDTEYLKEINDWHKKRINNLKKENGWLNLVGLYWLSEGENTFGSDKSNDIVFPEGKAEKFIGKIIKHDSIITTHIYSGVDVFYKDTSVQKIKMLSDLTGNPTVLNHRTLKWFVIKRDDKFGIRLRDLEADLLSSFKGIERYPVQNKWRIYAKFIRNDFPKKIMVPSIIGTLSESYSPGTLSFNVDNEKYTLQPTISGGGRLFIVFADLTSGNETYGAGRFLYAEGPDSNNIVILDFNKAYNPPCAFTKYATCPLPLEENKLKLRITAGEKNYGELH